MNELRHTDKAATRSSILRRRFGAKWGLVKTILSEAEQRGKADSQVEPAHVRSVTGMTSRQVSYWLQKLVGEQLLRPCGRSAAHPRGAYRITPLGVECLYGEEDGERERLAHLITTLQPDCAQRYLKALLAQREVIGEMIRTRGGALTPAERVLLVELDRLEIGRES